MKSAPTRRAPSKKQKKEEGAAPECSPSTVGGEYSITGLTAGEYIVEFSTPFNGTLDYITQYYLGAETFEGSLPVNVASGQRVSGIDAELSKGGEVEGHVTRALGGAPLAGIEVCAWGVNSEAMACAETDSGGAYLITGLPIGSFKVGFRATPGSGLNYVTQYYKNETSYEAADPIAVKAEEKQEGINAAMALGAEIEGTVTSGETGAPSGDTLVCAFGEGEEVISCAVTAPSGNYTIAGLPTGSYTVAFLAEGPAEYYDQAFSESDATPVKVTAPEGDALNVDAVLPALPRKIVAPRVTGNATVGGTLTCEEGSYSGVPAPTLSVEWLREGEAVAGATSATYTVQTADAGHQLQCKVTATNVMGWLWVKTAGIPIPVPPPVSGNPACYATISHRRRPPQHHRCPPRHRRLACPHLPPSDHRPVELLRRSVQRDTAAALACRQPSPCDDARAGRGELLAAGRDGLERGHAPHRRWTLAPGGQRPSSGGGEAEGKPQRRHDNDARRLGDLITPRPDIAMGGPPEVCTPNDSPICGCSDGRRRENQTSLSRPT